VPWSAFLAIHRARGATLSWLLLPHPGGAWTRVWLDARGRVLPPGETGDGPFLFTGASLWSAEALALLPEGPSSVSALLPRLAHHGGIVAEPFPWREVGDADSLIATAATLAPDQEGRLPGCYLHPTAHPAGRLERCVLGPRAAPPAAVRDRDAFWYGDGDRQVRLGLK
jgi:hypothetical protein